MKEDNQVPTVSPVIKLKWSMALRKGRLNKARDECQEIRQEVDVDCHDLESCLKLLEERLKAFQGAYLL